MTRMVLLVSLIVILCASLPAHAGFYQFTLGSEVTQSTHPNVSVGDPFRISYVADSTDRNPDPTFGSYAATPATAEYPNVTTTSIGPGVEGISVRLLPATHTVEYAHIGGVEVIFRVSFAFPPGTLGSDALPLTLPVSTEAFGFFAERQGPGGYDIRGEVTSYESVEVPEPGAVGALCVSMMLHVRRGNRFMRRIL